MDKPCELLESRQLEGAAHISFRSLIHLFITHQVSDNEKLLVHLAFLFHY